MSRRSTANGQLVRNLSTGLALFLMVALMFVAGCAKSRSSPPQESAQPNVAQGSCLECHSSSEKLKADLEKDPLPEVAKSTESAGEG